MEAMALQALRNLGFAYKELPTNDTDQYEESMEENFVFAGIMSMIDPPRPEVKDAINICRNAGIRVVMITGDHKLTAIAVAKELNLLGENVEEGQVLMGKELEEMTDEQLEYMVEKVVIYARVAPEHKSRIVKAWKKKDQIVAMTGDGVNDAPALKMSDIGIAMGISGTEVTKEAADMPSRRQLRQHSQSCSRRSRIKRASKVPIKQAMCTVESTFIAVVSVPTCTLALARFEILIGGAAIALTAVQTLWINLVTDGLPATRSRPRRPRLNGTQTCHPKESIFTRDVKVYLIMVPIFTTALILAAYFSHYAMAKQNNLEVRTQLFT